MIYYLYSLLLEEYAKDYEYALEVIMELKSQEIADNLIERLHGVKNG